VLALLGYLSEESHTAIVGASEAVNSVVFIVTIRATWRSSQGITLRALIG
jgi:hypothetical protein